jgi:leucyl aminopeptidase
MLELKSFTPGKTPVDTLVLLCAGDHVFYRHQALVDMVSLAGDLPEFQGDSGEMVTFYDRTELRSRRVVLIGVGKAAEITAETWRQSAGKAVGLAVEKQFGTLAIAVPEVGEDTLPATVTAMLEGGCLANHRFQAYKSEIKHPPLKKIVFLMPPDKRRRFSRLPRRVENICRAVLTARDWVNMPSNDKRPQQFVATVKTAAGKEGLTVSVLNAQQLKRKKMGAILAVAAGSDSPPALMLLEHKPAKAKATATIALVGKGVTFDSGGINLKPSGSLEDMKIDMAGAAAVAAALIAAARTNAPIHLIGVIPVVENMVSGGATRPGDVIRTYSGKTVEIGNTDAEGRLILADALAYVIDRYHPDTVADLATLTGACVVALGEKIAGVFSPDSDLTDEIVQAGETVHERCWPMPLPDDYNELLKSDIADMKNIGSTRWGGAITAALFLSAFVDDTRWVHIDIAGPAFAKKGGDYCGPGATGFGVRLLLEWLSRV